MPHRVAVYADLLPASELLARAFDKDRLFGDFVHPHRHQYPNDVYLYWLRILRLIYLNPLGDPLIVTYTVTTNSNQQITGIAHWERKHGNAPKGSLASKAIIKSIKAYNALENYTYPNRAIDNGHAAVISQGNPFFEHHWAGPRADSWYLSLLAVDPSFGKQGYGRELVAWGFHRAVEDRISCSVVSIAGQERFYRACGFDVDVGTTNDEGADENPLVAAGIEPQHIFSHDHAPTMGNVSRDSEMIT